MLLTRRTSRNIVGRSKNLCSTARCYSQFRPQASAILSSTTIPPTFLSSRHQHNAHFSTSRKLLISFSNPLSKSFNSQPALNHDLFMDLTRQLPLSSHKRLDDFIDEQGLAVLNLILSDLSPSAMSLYLFLSKSYPNSREKLTRILDSRHFRKLLDKSFEELYSTFVNKDIENISRIGILSLEISAILETLLKISETEPASESETDSAVKSKPGYENSEHQNLDYDKSLSLESSDIVKKFAELRSDLERLKSELSQQKEHFSNFNGIIDEFKNSKNSTKIDYESAFPNTSKIIALVENLLNESPTFKKEIEKASEAFKFQSSNNSNIAKEYWKKLLNSYPTLNSTLASYIDQLNILSEKGQEGSFKKNLQNILDARNKNIHEIFSRFQTEGKKDTSLYINSVIEQMVKDEKLMTPEKFNQFETIITSKLNSLMKKVEESYLHDQNLANKISGIEKNYEVSKSNISKINPLAQDVDELRSWLEKTEKQLSEINSNYKNVKLFDGESKRLFEITGDLNTREKQLTSQVTELQLQQSKLQALFSEFKQLTKKTEGAEKFLKDSGAQKIRLEQQNENLKRLEIKIDSLATQIEHFGPEIKNLWSQISKIKKGYEEVNSIVPDIRALIQKGSDAEFLENKFSERMEKYEKSLNTDLTKKIMLASLKNVKKAAFLVVRDGGKAVKVAFPPSDTEIFYNIWDKSSVLETPENFRKITKRYRRLGYKLIGGGNDFVVLYRCSTPFFIRLKKAVALLVGCFVGIFMLMFFISLIKEMLKETEKQKQIRKKMDEYLENNKT